MAGAKPIARRNGVVMYALRPVSRSMRWFQYSFRPSSSIGSSNSLLARMP